MRVCMLPHKGDRNGNPFLRILRSALDRQGVRVGPVSRSWQQLPSALHVHWLETPVWGRIQSRLPFLAEIHVTNTVHLGRRLRLAGKPVVWTAHNLAPHDYFKPWHREVYLRFRFQFLPLVTDVICMSESVVESVQNEFPELVNARFHVVRHPHYIHHFKSSCSKMPPELTLDRRENGLIISTFGLIRPYKNIPATIREMRSADFAFEFIVAGKGPDLEMEKIREAIGGDRRFTYISRRLSDSEVTGLIGASDLVLLNFKKILNSGSILACLSLGCPVLAPNFGSIVDLGNEVGTGWVQTFDGDLSVGDVRNAISRIPSGGQPDLSAFDPQKIAEEHISIYSSQRLGHR